MKRYKIAAILLLILGLAQMAGDIFSLPPLKAIAAATGASPAPKVFSAVNGFETYSTAFCLTWENQQGQTQRLIITPQCYAQLRGPYNRRNVYGAALAYGPLLVTNEHTRPMFDAVTRHALRGNAIVLRELGVDPDTIASPVRVEYQPINANLPVGLPLIIEVADD